MESDAALGISGSDNYRFHTWVVTHVHVGGHTWEVFVSYTYGVRAKKELLRWRYEGGTKEVRRRYEGVGVDGIMGSRARYADANTTPTSVDYRTLMTPDDASIGNC